jgi:hypothetical protein
MWPRTAASGAVYQNASETGIGFIRDSAAGPKRACCKRCLNNYKPLRWFVSKSRPSPWTARSSKSIPTGRERKKKGPQAIGRSRGGWTTKIHMVAADARTAITFSLSPGQAHDARAGRELLFQMVLPLVPTALIMDRAYEGDQTRQLAIDLGYTPVVPPKENRVSPWEYESRSLQTAQRD